MNLLCLFLVNFIGFHGEVIERIKYLPNTEYKTKLNIQMQENDIEPTLKLTKLQGTSGFYRGFIVYDEDSDIHYLIVRKSLSNSQVTKFFEISKSGDSLKEYLLKTQNEENAVLEKSYVKNKMVIHVDVIHRCIFVKNLQTNEYERKDFEHAINTVIINEVIEGHAAAIDEVNNLFITTDKGKSWKKVSDDIAMFEWSIYGKNYFALKLYTTDNSTNFLIKADPINNNFIIISSNCESLKNQENVIYAVCLYERVKTLIVLSKSEVFKKAMFPVFLRPEEFIVHSASDTDIYVVVKNGSNYILYSSNIEDLKFVKLVESIGEKNYRNKSCIDVQTFPHLPGLIITQFNRGYNWGNQGTMISFNHGIDWEHLKLPSIINNIECTFPSCALILNLECDQHYGKKIQTGSKFPHLMLSSGRLLNTNYYYKNGLFISTDAGKTWSEGYEDYHHSVILNDGGIILLGSFYHGSLEYSYDQGETWKTFGHLRDTLNIFYIDTKVKSQNKDSTSALIIASDKSDNWVILKIDFIEILKKKCSLTDYNLFTPGSSGPHQCFNGERSTFYVLKRGVRCLSILKVLKNNQKLVCPCTNKDFGCNFGYFNKKENCVLDPDMISQNDSKKCQNGHFVDIKNYKIKFSHNKCLSNKDDIEEQTMYLCGLEDRYDIFSVRSDKKIFFMNVKNMKTFEELSFNMKEKTISYDIDIEEKCLYQATESIIYRNCWSNKAKLEAKSLEFWKSTQISKIQIDHLSKTLFLARHDSISIISLTKHIEKSLHKGSLILYFELFSNEGYYLFSIPGSNKGQSLVHFVPLAIENKEFKAEIKGLVKGSYFIPKNNSLVVIGSEQTYIYSIRKISSHYHYNYSSWDIVFNHTQRDDFITKFFVDELEYDFFKTHVIHKESKIFSQSILEARFFPSVTHKMKVCHLSKCEYFCMQTGDINSCLCPDTMERKSGYVCVCKQDHPNCKSCMPTQFLCKSGECVDILDKCDGILQCQDGSDEKGCQAPCSVLNEFTCSDHMTCISIKSRCDGINDCPDSSDEFGCVERFTCNQYEFQCKNKKCININLICDGHDDCGDRSDENMCKELTCGEKKYECEDGNCIDEHFYCDGKFDCDDWSDESRCGVDYSNNPKKCVLLCDRKCLPNSMICNHITDCSDGSDELNCKHIVNCQNKNLRFCLSGLECYSETQRCDGFKDCQDGSDEFNCHNKFNQCNGISPFRCIDQSCIQMNFFCDGQKQCQNGTDEDNCNYLFVKTLKVNKISRASAEISWDTNFPSSNTKFSIKVYVWKTLSPHEILESQMKKSYLIKNLSPCVQYHVIVSVYGFKNGRSAQFVTFSTPRIPPLNLKFNKTSRKLSWITNSDEWCAPVDYFVSCQDGYVQYKNFTKNSEIIIPTLYASCNVAACPTNVFNISCSPYVNIVIQTRSSILKGVFIVFSITIIIFALYFLFKYVPKSKIYSTFEYFKSGSSSYTYRPIHFQNQESDHLLLEDENF